jgi:1,2-diacylglycerol 3-alpha-glucosyltransferase
MRVVVMFDHFGPYHRARVQAAIRRGAEEGFEVRGLETFGDSWEYSWTSPARSSAGRTITLFPGKRPRRPLFPAIGYRVVQALSALRPTAVAICGYREAAALAALAWAKTRGNIAILMSESSYGDKPRHRLGEWGKRLLVRRCDAALVGGRRQQAYAARLGIPEERIFLGYDVVDNRHFAAGALAARRRAKEHSQRLGLVNSFFLTVCRFIPKKNLGLLLEAYRRYRNVAGAGAWDLVLCGAGPLEEALARQARDIGGVHFPGFQQIEALPIFYGLASVFILASSHFEQWGLVVNEAMASGLPVLVSRACGCAPELVRQGVNGFTFDPGDLEGLARLMLKMSSPAVDLKAMGAASARLIAPWTPETFARNLFQAIKSADNYRRRAGF